MSDSIAIAKSSISQNRALLISRASSLSICSSERMRVRTRVKTRVRTRVRLKVKGNESARVHLFPSH